MDKFANLPTPLKWFLGVTGLGALLGLGGIAGSGSWKFLIIFVIVLIVLLGLIVGGFMLWNVWQRRKQSARLGSEINQSTGASPRGMSATDLAKLDSLRKKFQEGVEAFRSRGKDLYALPWYVIIGEPGSGKTEAIRHCNVGFPPGMHEGDNSVGYMGAGGTINMNWWFTNHAVMLDTAGRLVFEEVKPGDTSEWREFLKLLKKNRPNCPINGLLLVVPSDSLIKDAAEQIAAKAGKIAQQLDMIQRVLDFRFPVYVVITKSDKINGFREFFENVTDPQLQHQIMGWSNPEPLDSSFKPELVDRHLMQVADRLRRRRLGLLRDPIPETAPRRTDEVDSLFVLPNSLLMLTPRLRRYLETIFMPGEWSAKPLFLRGIYFTSSMREGAALDQELAEAIGVSADELPEGKVWERDRAYFLRDLFMEKVFREKGLVTRATNVKAKLQRNQLVLYSSTLAALVIFIFIAWFGMKTVRGRVKDRSDFWAFAAKVGWDDKAWHYAVLREDLDTGNYTPFTNHVRFVDAQMTAAEVQQRIRELAEDELRGKWTAPGLAASYNNHSKQAQRVIFETGVLQPLMAAVNKRMREARTGGPQLYLSDSLSTLIRLESDILSREKGDEVPFDARLAANFLGSLWRYAAGADTPLDANLAPVMTWTYATNKYGRDAWPPAWLSATTTSANATNNTVIATGLDNFIRQATNAVQHVGTNWAQITNFAAALTVFDRTDGDFLAAIPDPDRMSRAFFPLKAAGEKLAGLSADLSRNELTKGGVTLLNAFQNYTNQIMNFGMRAFERVEKETADGRKKHGDYPVFMQVARRLQAERNNFNTALASIVTAAEMQEYKRLDEECLVLKDGVAAWERRWRLYAGVANLSDFIGFPLLLDSGRIMTQDNVDQSAAILQDLVASVNTESIQQLKFKDVETWKNFTNRVANLQRLADLLKTRDKPNVCTVTLLKMEDSTRADDAWRSRYRYIKIAGDNTRMENTNIGQDQELGKLNLNKPCSFQLYQRDDDKEPGQVLGRGDWGTLALVGRYAQPVREGDFTTWLVKRPVEGNGGVLRVRLTFEEPLVDLEKWPKQ
jgi:GTP-binding protein EngB required for normal cell division